MIIIVTMDFTSVKTVSHFEARELVESKSQELIVTSSRGHFKLCNLDYGYDVIALYKDGSYCRLSELLESSYPYCEKKVTRCHDTVKMLMREAFEFRDADSFSNKCLELCGKIETSKAVIPHKIIEIYVDYVPEGGVCSFVESLDLKNKGLGFRTSSLEFFRFDSLDDGYTVLAMKENGSFCDLQEFLSNKFKYMDKEIRRSHDAYKFLRSNAIIFRGE
ncbi:hypothetical protein [Vibrio sp. D431a]|uniref:hypothetical protein n=1 Tax=Vibrio sp. D431a TaxID=2837388 RepID=UPI002556711B|nr:hypothetical protein [Vibrio sp. D431a]MDK9790123.1 hypothetical protein [Vibrio sp. D431a]